jgi:hypothetical protein
MRRVRYSVAATLDGFIADSDGGYDWIVMDESIALSIVFHPFAMMLRGVAAIAGAGVAIHHL